MKCFQLCSPVLISSSLSLITPAKDRAESVVVCAEGGVSGGRNEVLAWRELSRVVRSAVAGTHQMRRFSCFPAISAACAAVVLGWLVKVIQKLAWGCADTRKVNLGSPSPPSSLLVTLHS